MNDNIRLKWEPLNRTPLDEIEVQLSEFFADKSTGVTILKNGTLLFIDDEGNSVENAKEAMNEARFILDFRVAPIGDEAFLVVLHSAIAVYVSKEEFESVKDEVKARISELRFPSEEHIVPSGWSENDYLVGVYGRGKLQFDAYNFEYHKRLEFGNK
ncbi:hypothetical protein [Microbulbifer sp. GL-2]|uniref:hypothetical protein n=1 Tax=Microbulbifer sp. GL-2 TaxID=2591606 RepID=UPI001165155F|nr:hypothetical protein [Microbulbifer sp. GL-2]BBM03411.1 hypothetical protein GL2_34850 [Microbulbifer sp. GL-2]BBM03719.1 hypothetical protein GL2_37930 [Microbulbifer sp. GL-2]